MKRERIDQLLVTNGLADSIEKAAALVMSGIVLASEQRVEKPSQRFPLDEAIRIKGDNLGSKYVGRGGLKLEKALSDFHICLHAYMCIDIGSSTGGFTDCLLQNGARRVVAVDAGTNQLVWSLRIDERVEVRENTNARHLKPEDFSEKFDLAVIDVAFISVRKILPAIERLIRDSGRIIVLIKPQFEVERGQVGPGGIVRDPLLHEQVVGNINRFAGSIGLESLGLIESPILGADGNKEFLSLYGRSTVMEGSDEGIKNESER